MGLEEKKKNNDVIIFLTRKPTYSLPILAGDLVIQHHKSLFQVILKCFEILKCATIIIQFGILFCLQTVVAMTAKYRPAPMPRRVTRTVLDHRVSPAMSWRRHPGPPLAPPLMRRMVGPLACRVAPLKQFPTALIAQHPRLSPILNLPRLETG